MRCKQLHTKKTVYRSCKSQAITQLSFGGGCMQFLPQTPSQPDSPDPQHTTGEAFGALTQEAQQKTVPLHLQSHTVKGAPLTPNSSPDSVP